MPMVLKIMQITCPTLKNWKFNDRVWPSMLTPSGFLITMQFLLLPSLSWMKLLCLELVNEFFRLRVVRC